jgi:hypothetical protein
MSHEIREKVKTFYDELNSVENHRYKSWEHCYFYFQADNPNFETDKACLHLAFYLASWGMYRGSSPLLQKDYKIHMEVVEKLWNLESKQYLQSLDFSNLQDADISDIVKLMNEIKKIYAKHKVEEKDVSASNTLVTKILLGTIGCVPAYDRFFIDGLKQCGISPKSAPSKKSLQSVVNFYCEHKKEFDAVANHIEKSNKSAVKYPPMKLVDMYFWQIGYDKAEAEKSKN